MRTRLEAGALVVAGLLVVAFVVSMIMGVRLRGAGPAGDVVPAADPAALPPAAAAGIRVEVLNGSARPGLAREATERLRAAGYDVVFFGNYGEPRGLSMVVDRGGRAEAARAVAASLGIRDVRSDPDASRMVDVSIVLGKDWPPAPAAQKPGWKERLRGLF